MASLGVTEDDIAHGVVTPAIQALLQRQIADARATYDDGISGILLLPASMQLPILIAARLYRAILGRIERNGYDVFTRRARTSRMEKLAEAGGAIGYLISNWWRGVFSPKSARA